MKDQAKWNAYVESHTDPYVIVVIGIAERVMELLDADPTKLENSYTGAHTARGLILQAADGDLTSRMLMSAAAMVSIYHERGNEFRVSYNGGNADPITN